MQLDTQLTADYFFASKMLNFFLTKGIKKFTRVNSKVCFR